MTVTTQRPLHEIAREIIDNWPRPYFRAVPYIRALTELTRIDDSYGADDGREMVVYFLANAKTWKGDVARRVKAELKELLK